MIPSYEEILQASSECSGFIRKTPLDFSATFTKMTGSRVYLKSEYHQRTGAFKIRGAFYKIKKLSKEEKARGVIAASAGNHAQGVALAASTEGIGCTIVMPQNASPAKVAATKGYGASVILAGSNYEESWNKARDLSASTGATIIHAFDDPQIIAAQGVIGLEILEQLPDVDEVYVPIGGGGLAAGVLIAIKTKRPDVRVIGVQSSSFPAMKKSVESGRLQITGGDRTIADGISVKRPGETTMRIIAELIDEIVLVDDSKIIQTMFLLMERMKAVVEPAGAASLAYMLHRHPPQDKKVVAILAGGNVDMYLLGQIVDKGLAFMGRMLKISILLPDRPGALKDVVDEITSANANIVEVVHDRFSSGVNAGSAGVTLSLETHGTENTERLIERLRKRKIQFNLTS